MKVTLFDYTTVAYYVQVAKDNGSLEVVLPNKQP